LVRFRNLLRHLRLPSRFRSGCLPSRDQADSGLIRFQNRGSQLHRSGVLHQAKALRLVLLKGSRRDPVLVQFLGLLANARLFHRGRVVRGRSVIPTRVGLDNQGLLESLRLSGLINRVPPGQLHKGDRSNLPVGRCLNPGARRNLLRGESQEVLLKAGISQAFRLLDHLSSELQKARGRRTKRLLSRVRLVGRWIGTPRSIRY
jgi:hypothetical protein